ncbi:MAG: sugar phosphate nucleotidyltransferase [Acidimicrobiia bacterium]|jgi:UTP--glucose-1-phosphate uridylyltransferase
MTQVDVAVIPAAGRGTRMRPATRVVPKALLTVVDRPAIQYAVEEAARAGATEAILVVDLDAGHLVQRHFMGDDRLPGLEHVRVRPVVQEEPLGLGHAVLEAREMVGDRPFFCVLADDIVHPDHDVLSGLAEAAGTDDISVICLQRLTEDQLSSKGVVVPASDEYGEVVELAGAVEKPGPERAPSRLGILGRYLFTPEVFELLAGLEPGVGGEIQLTDAIDALGRRGRLRGVVADRELLDIGNPLGLLDASVVLGLARFGDEFRRHLLDELGS